MQKSHNLKTLITQRVSKVSIKSNKLLLLSFAENSLPVRFRNAFNKELTSVLFAPKVKGLVVSPAYLKSFNDDDQKFISKSPSVLSTGKTAMIDLNYLFYIDFFRKYKNRNKLSSSILDKVDVILNKILDPEKFKLKGYSDIVFNYQLDLTDIDEKFTKSDIKTTMLGVLFFMLNSKDYKFPFNELIITLKKNNNFISFLAYDGTKFNPEAILKVINSFIVSDESNNMISDTKIQSITKTLNNKNIDQDSMSTIIDIIQDYQRVNPDKKVSGDSNNIKLILKEKLKEEDIDIRSNEFDAIVKKLLTVYPPKINIPNNDNIFNETMNIKKSIGNGLNFREHTFKDSFKDQIKLFSKYYTDRYNISVDNIHIKDHDFGDIDNTVVKKVTYSFVDNETGKKFNLSLNMPDLLDDQIVEQGGNKKILLYQVYQMPIQSPKPFESIFKSNYSSITAKSIVKNKNQGLFFYAMGKQISAMSYLSIIALQSCKGKCEDCIDKIMNACNIKKNEYAITDDESILKKNKYSFKNGKDYIYLTEKSSNKSKQMVWGFKIDMRNSLMDGCNKINESFEGAYGQNLIKKLKQLDDNIIDPVTEFTLKHEQLPNDTNKLYHMITDNAISGATTNQISLNNRRIRSSESIAISMSKKITAVLNDYDKHKKLGKKVEPKIDENALMQDLSTGQLQSQFAMVQDNNPWGEIAAQSQITFAGYDGIKGDNAVSSVRGVDPTYYGNIDPIDTPDSASVGVTRNLSVDATLKNMNGNFKVNNIENDKINPLSVISNYSSAPLHNDGNRLQFVSAHLKSDVPLTNAELPLIMSMYSNVPAELASDTFIKKSPVKGKVIDIRSDCVIIQDAKKKKHIVNFEKHEILTKKASSTNGSFVKIGDVVNEGSPVAGAVEYFKYNNLLAGVNLYTLLKPHGVYNFEDGMIISESVGLKMQSNHGFEKVVEIAEDDIISNDIPVPGTIVSKDQPLLVISKKALFNESSNNTGNPLLEFDDEDFNDDDGNTSEENESPEENELDTDFNAKKILIKIGGEVFQLEIFAKSENVLKSQPKLYRIWKSQIAELSNKIKSLEQEGIDSNFLKEKYAKISKPWNKNYKGQKIKGVLLKFKIHGTKNTKSGDKLHNRHGKSFVAA